MPKVIELTDVSVQRVQIAFLGDDIIMHINFTLLGDADMPLVQPHNLSEDQKQALYDFLKPYIEAIASEQKVNLPAWAKEQIEPKEEEIKDEV